MTTLREAAEKAVEAIERYQVKRQDFERFADVLTDLRAALAEPEPEPVKTFYIEVYGQQYRVVPFDLGNTPLYTRSAP